MGQYLRHETTRDPNFIGSGTASTDVRLRIWYVSTEGVSDSSNDFDVTGDFPNRTNVDLTISIPFGGGEQLVYDETITVSTVYGSSVTVNFWSSLSGIDYWGGTIYESGSHTVPARPYQSPTAPSGVSASRNSDTSHTVAWSRNATTAAPYSSQRVQRQTFTYDGWSAWVTVATVSGTATSYTDTSTRDNRAYQWRIVAVNSSGTGTSASSAILHTTPTDPESLSAVKTASGDIRLDWTGRPPYGAFDTEVWESQDGGAYSQIATVASGLFTWTHASPSPTVTHRYRIRFTTNSTVAVSSGYEYSETVQLAAPPNAPSGLGPSTTHDATEARTLGWTHNPVDTSAQSAFQVRHRNAGGTWAYTGKITSTVSEWTLPADAYANGDTPEWEVQTWGQHVDPSPYSSTASFATSARPTVAVSEPGDGSTLTDSALVVGWAYFHVASSPQSQWRVTLLNDGSTVEVKSGSGATDSVTMDTAVSDGATYTVRVEVQSGAGLWSEPIESTFTVSYLPPSEVAFTATFDRTSGAALLNLSPEPWDGVATVEPVMVDVERSVDGGGSWSSIVKGLPLSGPDLTIPDALPLTRGTNLYRTTATSATPSSVTSDPVELVVDEGTYAYLNYASGFGTALTFYGNLALTSGAGRTEVIENFAGRTGDSGRPAGVLISGETRSREVGVSVRLLRSDGFATHESFEDAALTGGVMCYRDPTGRRMFGRFTLGGTSIAWAPMADVNFTITELGHTA